MESDNNFIDQNNEKEIDFEYLGMGSDKKPDYINFYPNRNENCFKGWY